MAPPQPLENSPLNQVRQLKGVLGRWQIEICGTHHLLDMSSQKFRAAPIKVPNEPVKYKWILTSDDEPQLRNSPGNTPPMCLVTHFLGVLEEKGYLVQSSHSMSGEGTGPVSVWTLKSVWLE